MSAVCDLKSFNWSEFCWPPLIGPFSLSLSAEDQAGVQGQKRKRDVDDEGEDDDDDEDD